jgi:hypothetical protein
VLYEFKSKAGGTVVMTQPVAEQLLDIIGKPPARAGVFEPGQLPAAIAALEAAVAREQPVSDDDDEQQSVPPMARPVSLRQRAWPLLELFRAALAREQRVTWGV